MSTYNANDYDDVEDYVTDCMSNFTIANNMDDTTYELILDIIKVLTGKRYRSLSTLHIDMYHVYSLDLPSTYASMTKYKSFLDKNNIKLSKLSKHVQIITLLRKILKCVGFRLCKVSKKEEYRCKAI